VITESGPAYLEVYRPGEERPGFKAHAPGYMMSNLVDARINRESARERTRGFPNFDDIHPQR
jgi:hypothetical protein